MILSDMEEYDDIFGMDTEEYILYQEDHDQEYDTGH